MQDTLENARIVDKYVVFVTDVLISIALILVTVWLVYRNRHNALSTKFKFSFCMLFLMIAFYDIRNIYLVVNQLTFYEAYNSSSVFFLMMDNLGNIMMLTFNWFFTSHYLKVACLFKLTFSQHTHSNL